MSSFFIQIPAYFGYMLEMGCRVQCDVQYDNCADYAVTVSFMREALLQEKMFSFWHCPNYLSPPLSPIRATWCFFSDVKIQDLKVTCGEGREIY